MRRQVALVSGVLALVITLISAGVLAVHAYQDWQNLGRPTAESLGDTSRIQPWMTVRFVAMSHHVPITALAMQLGAPPGGNISLATLARVRNVPVSEELAIARDSVAQLRASSGTPGPQSGARGP